MKFAGKMYLMIISKVTKNQGSHLSLEDTFFEKQQGGGQMTLPPFLSCLRVKGKAAGLDGIPPEVFMFADIDDIILKFANNLLLNLEKPAQWSTSHIQPIPKTGELSEFGTYRGIALSPVAAKVTNKMLLNPIQPI